MVTAASSSTNYQSIAKDLRTIAYFLANEPDEEMIEQLDSKDAELIFGMNPVSDLIDLTGMELAASELSTEYAQLFIGPGAAYVPVESVQRGDMQYMGKCTMDVLDAYNNEGFHLSDNAREMPDHISVELDFVATLIEQKQYREMRLFIYDHINEWVPKWVKSFSPAARWAFYPLVANYLLESLESLSE